MDCLAQHPLCGAQCCKQFTIKGFPEPVKKGMIVSWHEPSASMRWYYQLHGATIRRERIDVKLDDYKQVGGVIVVQARCSYLNDDLTCKGHAMGRKPLICKRFGEDSTLNHCATPGCLVKKEDCTCASCKQCTG